MLAILHAARDAPLPHWRLVQGRQQLLRVLPSTYPLGEADAEGAVEVSTVVLPAVADTREPGVYRQTSQVRATSEPESDVVSW